MKPTLRARWSWVTPGTAFLVAILAIVVAWALWQLITGYPLGVDLEIPLRAAEHWLRGEDPYPPNAFDAPNGPDLPFLYPPFLLPLIAPLTFLPRAAVSVAWVILLVLAGWFAGRRLGFGPVVAALALLWPPFAEGILGGNVQILLFAAFATLMYHAGRQLDPAGHERVAAIDGALAAFVGALKISQVHAWLYVLRRRPFAALPGVALFAVIAIATLPFVGVDTWFAWAAQAGRSGDPGWAPVGAPLSIFVGSPVALAVSVASAAAVFVVPPRQAGAWIGILTLVGAPALHMFGLLFLLPAMRLVRREIGFVAAILVATYYAAAIWAAILLVAWTLAAGYRWPSLRAPDPRTE